MIENTRPRQQSFKKYWAKRKAFGEKIQRRIYIHYIRFRHDYRNDYFFEMHKVKNTIKSDRRWISNIMCI